jgi:drug/metabolite transporter (DMT)-like permease
MAPRDISYSAIEPPVVKPVAGPTMGRTEWAMLGLLALVWGSAFLFIKVAVTSFDPLTYVWLRLLIAATALVAFLRIAGHRLVLPAPVWAAVGLLALLNNVVPFLLFGW